MISTSFTGCDSNFCCLLSVLFTQGLSKIITELSSFKLNSASENYSNNPIPDSSKMHSGFDQTIVTIGKKMIRLAKNHIFLEQLWTASWFFSGSSQWNRGKITTITNMADCGHCDIIICCHCTLHPLCSLHHRPQEEGKVSEVHFTFWRTILATYSAGIYLIKEGIHTFEIIFSFRPTQKPEQAIFNPYATALTMTPINKRKIVGQRDSNHSMDFSTPQYVYWTCENSSCISSYHIFSPVLKHAHVSSS